MQSLGGLLVLLFIGGIGYAVIKFGDKKVFAAGNGILLLLLLGQFVYMLFDWLSRR